MPVPQRPAGLDMKLSQPNMSLSYPPNYKNWVNWRCEMIEGLDDGRVK